MYLNVNTKRQNYNTLHQLYATSIVSILIPLLQIYRQIYAIAHHKQFYSLTNVNNTL